MSNDLLLKMTSRTDEYLDSVQERSALPTEASFAVEAHHIAPPADDALFKYVSESTWSHIEAGSFQLGSCDYYQSIEDDSARDIREGECMVALRNGPDQVNLGVRSGFNCALFCGTSAPHDDAEMKRKFGGRILRISPLSEFAEALRKRIRANRAFVRDVVYTNGKTAVLDHPDASALRSYCATMRDGVLDIKGLNRKFFELFYEVGLVTTLFVKPTRYAHERERRVVLERDKDLPTQTIRFKDRSLLQYIELVQ